MASSDLSRQPSLSVMVSALGHDGHIELRVDLGECSSPKANFWLCGHLTTVLVDVILEPNLEESDNCSQYANMTESITLPNKL